MFPKYPRAVASSVNKPTKAFPSLILPEVIINFFSYTTFPSSIKQIVPLLFPSKNFTGIVIFIFSPTEALTSLE